MLYQLVPVGVITKNGKTVIEILPEFTEAMDGLRVGQRILLFLWFHKSEGKRNILKVHTHGELGNPLRGVFATRSPVRPNPIALYNVKIRCMVGNRIMIDDIDAYDGTPVIDIKPFVKKLDCPE